jgi:hypothetical protein
MTKRSILLTEATGYIAGLLLPALRERYDLRLTDAHSTDRQGQPVEGVIVTGPAHHQAGGRSMQAFTIRATKAVTISMPTDMAINLQADRSYCAI